MRELLLAVVFICLCTLVRANKPTNITKLYNEATTAYENGDMATAIYNLELAALICPSDKEIANNLSIAKTKVAVDVVEIDQFFLAKWIERTASILSTGSWKFVTIGFMILISLLLFFRLIRRVNSPLTSNMVIGGLSVLVLASMYLGSYRQASLVDGRYAVVMDSEISGLKQGPDEVSKEVKDISPGVKLEIIDSSENWYKVSAMDKEQGWIKKEAVRRISINP